MSSDRLIFFTFSLPVTVAQVKNSPVNLVSYLLLLVYPTSDKTLSFLSLCCLPTCCSHYANCTHYSTPGWTISLILPLSVLKTLCSIIDISARFPFLEHTLNHTTLLSSQWLPIVYKRTSEYTAIKQSLLCFFYLLDEPHDLIFPIFPDAYLVLQPFCTDQAVSRLSHCIPCFSSWKSFSPLVHLANFCFSLHRFCLHSVTWEFIAAACRITFAPT